MADRPAGRATAFGLLALGSLLGLLLATQPWWTHPAGDITGNLGTATLTGVLAGAAAAGTGLAALSGRGARTVLGILLLVLGGAMVVVAITATVEATEIPTAMLGDRASGQELRATRARWAYLASGVLVAAGAGVLLLRARHWPDRRDRYARVRARASTTAEDDPADVWKAMDAGFDPTEPPPPRDPTGRNPPDRGE